MMGILYSFSLLVFTSLLMTLDTSAQRTCRGVPCNFFNTKQLASRITLPQPPQRNNFFNHNFFNNPAFALNPLFRPRTPVRPRNQFAPNARQPNFRPQFRPPPAQQAGGVIPTRAQSDAIIAELQSQLAQKSNLRALFVELGFHACVGGCDGCLNLNVPENKGLRQTYADLRALHRRHSSSITFADLVFLAAAEGANKGIDATQETQRRVTPRYGRRTCDSPDNPTKPQTFPSGDDPKAFETLGRMFSMNNQEVMALMGAHSLGECHRENLGFVGAWDNSPDKLDNGYYKSLVGTNWVSVPTSTGSTQWVLFGSEADKNIDLSRQVPGRMMLNADMIWRVDFTVSGANKVPSCKEASVEPTSNCPQSRHIEQAITYSLDENRDMFFRDFIAAFEKMIQFGHPALRTV